MDSEARRVRCTKRPAENAKRNVKFLSSPEKTVRSIARIASRSARMPAAAKSDRKISCTEYGVFYRTPYVLRKKISHPFNGLGHTRQGDPYCVPLGKIIHKDRGVATPIANLKR